MKRTLGLVATIMALLLGLSGCGSNGASGGETGSGKITVQDAHGEVSLDKVPERIVVMDFGALDTLKALGMGDRVVGIPQGGTVPPHLEEFAGEGVENVGSPKEPDMEAINRAKPDLVVVGGRQADFYEDINKVFPTLDVSYDKGMDAIEATEYQADLLGQATGTSDLADQKVEAMKDAAEKKEDVLEDQTALVVMTTGGKVSLHGEESRFGLVHSLLGAEPAVENISNDKHGQPASFEALAKADPDIMFVVDRDSVVSGGGENAEVLLDNDLVNGTKAAKNDKMVYLDASRWYLTVTGLENVPAMLDQASSVA